MRVRRDISSIPLRSASETWQRIIDLVTSQGSKDTQQLKSAAGVMGSIITDEHPSVRAIMLEGVGPQLRIYLRYGMKALEEGTDVDALTWNPTAGDWTMHVPCDEENMEWVKKSLAPNHRIRVFDVAEADRAEDEEKTVRYQGEQHRRGLESQRIKKQMSTYAYSQVFSQAHSIVFLSDNMRNTLREVIRENGISPDKLMQDWDTIERGIRTWLDSGHLNKIVVEFFKPGASEASARWEFPIGYAGSGVDDDMWLDKNYLRQLIAKSNATDN